MNKRNGPEATLIGSGPFAGKTLAQLTKEKQKPFEDILIDDIKPGGASGAYFVMDEALQERFITDTAIMFCSDGGPDMRHPRGYGTFPKIIEEHVVKKKLMSLPLAIKKMTSLPAQTMGLTDRGVLAVGKKADILVFAPEEIKATATYENPFQLAQGINDIVVNGKLAINQGTILPEKQGRMLRRM